MGTCRCVCVCVCVCLCVSDTEGKCLSLLLPLTPLPPTSSPPPPLSLRGPSSYVLTGTDQGLKDTFGSTCHGAGRALSRAKARYDKQLWLLTMW